MYEPRFYRDFSAIDNLLRYEVIEEESDLYVVSDVDLKERIKGLLSSYRSQIINYIKKDPQFQFSLSSHNIDKSAPEIVKTMAFETSKVNVGPMASVAGAVAEFIGRDISSECGTVIIENGGDIFAKVSQPVKIGIYAGSSLLSNKIAIEITPDETPLGICTSSGTVGPSLSFGKADAACVVAKSATFADACATAIGNMVKTEADVQRAVDFAATIEGIKGVVIIIENSIGIWGDIKIVKQ